jgi:Lrp/AsnC family transcriptional regulator for asnA, asnC and gidA
VCEGYFHGTRAATRDSVVTKRKTYGIARFTPMLPLTSAVRAARIERVTRANGRTERGRVNLDDVSKAIIEQLQQDGRRSYAAIGKVVGLSEAAVRQRVQRLIDHGVMQVVAVTDPLELGFSRQAMIGVKATGDLEPVADALVAMDEVDYVVVAAGSFDLLVEVVAESDEHLLEIVTKRIRAIPQVLSTETFVYLKLRKQTYSWGVR